LINASITAERGKKSDLIGQDTAIKDAESVCRTVLVSLAGDINWKIGHADVRSAEMIVRTLTVIGTLSADAGAADKTV
jgi:hypothetical protein